MNGCVSGFEGLNCIKGKFIFKKNYECYINWSLWF